MDSILFTVTEDSILDGITRHYILHALTVIEAAIFKVRYQLHVHIFYSVHT